MIGRQLVVDANTESKLREVALARVKVVTMDVPTNPGDSAFVSLPVVGRRVPGDLDPRLDTKAKALAWREALPTPFVPKGVDRFDSHEKAQQWAGECSDETALESREPSAEELAQRCARLNAVGARVPNPLATPTPNDRR